MFMRHPLIPRMFLEKSLNEMDMFFVYLEVLSFHVHLHLGQTWSHSFCFGFLLNEEVQQSYVHGNLGRTPLGVTPMTPNPSTIQPMNFVVSLFYGATFPCCTMRVWKVLRRVKNSLDVLSTLVWFTFPSCALRVLSPCGHSNAHLPPFPLPCLFKGRTSKESPSLLNFFLTLILFQNCGSIDEPMLASISPLVRQGKESFLRQKLFLAQPHPSPSSSSYFHMEGLLWPPPLLPRNFEPLPHVVHQ